VKKIRLIIVTIVCLVTTLVVSSFAWFAIGNNGLLSDPIETRNQLVIDFAPAGSNEEAMMPAKLKKGVINSPEGTIVGNSESVPKGSALLPKHDDDWNYVVENGQLITDNQYLDTPATIVYSQFALEIGSADETGYKDLLITFRVRYFNVNQIKDGENKTPIADLPLFEQMDALAFNFFLLEDEEGLLEEQLATISTNQGTVESNKTIERFMIEQQNNISFRTIDGKADNSELTADNIETKISNYRQEAIGDEESYKFTVTFYNIHLNQTYHILLESYYNVPDALVEGNLPLTGQFVLDLSYEHTEPSNPPQQ